MIIGVFAALLVVMLLLIARGVVGPTVFDRILIANSFGTVTVIFIVILGEFVGTPYFVDIAITYALINFITTIALLRYFKYGGGDSA
jgi:multicomponent Na+:H+ antiporter subunit F